MPQSKKKAERRAALAGQKTEIAGQSQEESVPEGYGAWQPKPPPPVHAIQPERIDAFTQFAAEACSLKVVRFACPRTLKQARYAAHIGRTTEQICEPQAVSDRNDVFHPELNPYGRMTIQDAMRITSGYLRWASKKPEQRQRTCTRQESGYKGEREITL